jgi:hypothetical protein
MKLSGGFIVSSLCCSALAASQPAHVYVYNADAQSAQQLDARPVDPETARLIFAKRLGVEQFHSIRNTEEKVIEQIARYGKGLAEPLFGELPPEQSNPAAALIWIEDVEDAKGNSSMAEIDIQSLTVHSYHSRLVGLFEQIHHIEPASQV